jgi:hypothetical protein
MDAAHSPISAPLEKCESYDIPSLMVGGGEQSRINGRKGGRHLAKQDPEALELRQLCKRVTPTVFEGIHRLAFHAKAENVRLAALTVLANYGHGKPPQSITGTGFAPVALTVITNVPKHPDFGKWAEEPPLLEAPVEPEP